VNKLALIAALALSACATNKMTVGQSVYLAYGSYGAAVKSFSEYAQGPSADANIVHAGRRVVDSPEAHAAVGFGRAYVACKGSSNTITIVVNCADWDFSNPTTVVFALRNITATLLATLPKGTGQ